MKTKHTPGPWIAANCTGKTCRILRNWGIFKNGKRLATVDSNPSVSVETDHANAKLIANAPQMHAALVAVDKALKGNGGSVDWSKVDDAHALVKEALAHCR